MVRRTKLDASRRARLKQLAVALLASLPLLSFPTLSSLAQTAPRVSSARLRVLYSARRWRVIVRLTRPAPGQPPYMDYYRGMALSKLKRWPEARQAFLRGWRKAPRDKRFPTELAGIAFLEKKYGIAKHYLKRALRMDPHDAYVQNFLATIYDLEGNLPAALAHWNRVKMPAIRRLLLNPQPAVNPVLLSNVFAFSPGTTLTASQWLTTQARLNAMDIFSSTRLQLDPLPGGRFDAQLVSTEHNEWGSGNVFRGMTSLLRGVPYDTVYPAFFNICHSATNLTSLLRWDPQKERVYFALDGPIANSPRWRYRAFLDGRRENWNLVSAYSLTPANGMQLEKIEGDAEIESIVSGRLRWSTGVDLSGRTFRRAPSATGFFTNGFAFEYSADLHALLLQFPDRRFTLQSSAATQLGKLFARGSSPYLQSEAGLCARWFPRAAGDDYKMTARLRAGKTWGLPPFDDLFILGLERDNNLWLRATIGTMNGRKGSAPLGRNYVLANWDDFKTLYSNGLFSIKLGPFFDTGKITDPSHEFGSRCWLADTGFELKARLLRGPTVELFFGKDLRTGRNTFYGLTEPIYGQ